MFSETLWLEFLSLSSNNRAAIASVPARSRRVEQGRQHFRGDGEVAQLGRVLTEIAEGDGQERPRFDGAQHGQFQFGRPGPVLCLFLRGHAAVFRFLQGVRPLEIDQRLSRLFQGLVAFELFLLDLPFLIDGRAAASVDGLIGLAQ